MGIYSAFISALSQFMSYFGSLPLYDNVTFILFIELMGVIVILLWLFRKVV